MDWKGCHSFWWWCPSKALAVSTTARGFILTWVHLLGNYLQVEKVVGILQPGTLFPRGKMWATSSIGLKVGTLLMEGNQKGES